MAVDYILLYLCAPKEQLGDGDPNLGTDRILEALKARTRANVLADMARRDGKDPHGQTITLRTVGPNREPIDVKQTYEELRAESDKLLPFEADCVGCPANVMGKPFGCVGVVNYPIPRTAEEWLMARLQTDAEFGGKLLQAMIRDFNYTGEPIQGFRTAGLFESKSPVQRNLGHGPAGPVVTSNQVFQALFCISEPLDPGHCLCVLCWLGCVAIGGTPVTDPLLMREVAALETPADRLARTSLDIGQASGDPGIAAMQRLLRALHASWVYDTRLWVSA
jgi:hypothetical protein